MYASASVKRPKTTASPCVGDKATTCCLQKRADDDQHVPGHRVLRWWFNFFSFTNSTRSNAVMSKAALYTAKIIYTHN